MARIRPAEPNDAARIVQMSAAVSAHEGLDPPAMTAQVLARFAFAERLLDVFVAEVDGQLVGHVIATRSFDVQCGSPIRWIADLYVEPAFRRRGLARRLIAAVAERAAADGAAYLQWLITPGNQEAESLYKKIGARRDGGVAMFLRAQEFDSLTACEDAE